MIRYPSSPFRENECAVALVIVLAFVVLITGVVIAFFSNSLLYRQISNSSASATKVDLFAQGAMDAIVGDFKQEIAAGSNATIYKDTNGNAVGQVYRPFNPNTAIPAQALSANASAGLSFASNLVKRSAYGQNFFPSSSDPGSANYNNGNTSESIAVTATPSASPPPAPKYLPSNRAAKSSTLSASQNGRFISLARWNKALLLPKVSITSDTDFTPVSPANGTSNVFVAPDWVLVARDGSNPTGAFNGNMASSSTAAGSVIGRYAYAIYDEGGLLDMNAAGYPTDSSGKSDPNVVYKAGLPFADLTQLSGISALSSARQKSVINSLVGWRNYASAQLTGGSLGAGFNFSGTPLTNFTTAMWGNTTGFLKTANTALANGQSDRMFATRQEMMNLLVQGIASSGGQSDRANVQNALQYLTSYSRTINQPSYAPLPASLTPDATHRPAVVASGSGGNNAFGLDNQINPSFPTVRVQMAKTTGRNDGTDMKLGEPLVKKRFALSRLGWLTYKGPSAPLCQSTVGASDPVIQALVTQGIPFGLLLQGTPANIKSYFGLTWQADANTATGVNGVADNQFKWFYNCHQWSPGPPAGTGTAGAIMKLGDIAALTTASKQHEADFFELLKAGINVGSLAKAAGSGYQYNYDQSVDWQVIQIAANIIDQFDVDGFPTRIVFDDGKGPLEFRGVENLPYIYAYRSVIMRLELAQPDVLGYYSGWDPNFLPPKTTDASGRRFGSSLTNGFQYASDSTHSVSQDGSTPARSPATLCPVLSKTGVNALMYLPELWNPHDVNSTRCALDANGNPITDNGNAMFPTRFRVVAQSSAPGIVPNAFNVTDGWGANGNQALSSNSNVDQSLTFPVYANLGAGGFKHSRKMTTANTGLYFDIPNNTAVAVANLFREPTLLFKPGIPNAGGLANGLTGKDPTGNGEDNAILKPNTSVDGQFKDGSVSFTSGSGTGDGFLTDPQVTTSRGYDATYYPRVIGGASEKYLGLYVDCVPMAFRSTSGSGNFDTMRQIYGGPTTITLFVQCECPPNSGKWVTYDQKVTAYNAGNQNQAYAQSGFMPYHQVSSNQSNVAYDLADPRTSRFGFSDCTTSLWLSGDSPRPMNGWLDEANGVRVSDRPDYQQGSGGAVGNYPALGFYASSYGLIAQNRPDNFNNNRAWMPDTANPPSPLVSSFYTDADGVARRAMGAYVVPGFNGNSGTQPAITVTGLPQTTAETAYTNLERKAGTTTPLTGPVTNTQSQSRPFILNRPFRSVTELGYVFKGTPWKNIDFFTPESGDGPLLDVFCVNDTDNPSGLVAGSVNLNTRQTTILQAVLNGGYKDEATNYPVPPVGVQPSLTTAEATSISKAFATRIKSGGTTINGAPTGPLTNVSELVGKWITLQTIPASVGIGNVTTNIAAPNNISGGLKIANLNPSYDGMTADLDTVFASSASTTNIQRMRESALRPLANVGQTRVWNVMIDLMAQTGRYPVSAVNLDNFSVEGEQRYWVHLAIDRYTGEVLEKQIEVVKE